MVYGDQKRTRIYESKQKFNLIKPRVIFNLHESVPRVEKKKKKKQKKIQKKNKKFIIFS